MLRYYDNENILKPNFVDSNGYRFYSDSEIEVINKIKHLRRYYFSYDEIKAILSNHQENDKNIYLAKLEELKTTVNDYDILISELEHTHTNSNIPKIVNNYDIQIGQRTSFYSLCKKSSLKANKIDNFIDKVVTKSVNSKIFFLGSYFITFLENKDSLEDMLEIEFCQPIESSKKLKGFETKHFQDTTYISTIHYGDYENINQAYIHLYKFTSNHNYKIIGSFSEKYYVDSYLTSHCNEFITEVSVAVLKY